KLSLESNKETIDAYINGKNTNDLILDHVEVTLKGGKPNEKIEWSLNGDATLGSQEATFNASGEAKAVITSKAPFKANPVISVNAMGKNLSKTITYDVRKFDPIFVYPSFKSELNTIDYKSDFKITVSGLLADSAVKVLKDEKVTPKKESFNVNDKGEATLEFSGISDYSIKDFKISIEYLKQGDIKDTKTSDT
ncbi:hypothetical protein, partial [Campylobacter sp. CNRCH_2016_0050h]|uniref:hypothetical protein n=1 Tax=Campylobacter sp. CNRCH_2016_0050h TaxID=2911608 RepID=UPI0021E6D338